MKNVVIIIALFSLLFSSCDNERSRNEEPRPKYEKPGNHKKTPGSKFDPEVNAWYKTTDGVLYQVLSNENDILMIRIYEHINSQPVCIATKSDKNKNLYDLEVVGSVYKCEIQLTSAPSFQLNLHGEKNEFEEPCDITGELAKIKE
ncbi:hypothetical protein [Flammeovirga sp. EKP202]|uniref:hypothetical protein n=1 Tax=Flammeovirga sp. EKP202 TaxID=2770592 RepID=UPI00165F5DAB|nr:hypothetical protein [Flammeovirga sp. EKP202]MBD0405483.1 hypothetical protein [Flammeovirga sp. EKP202]